MATLPQVDGNTASFVKPDGRTADGLIKRHALRFVYRRARTRMPSNKRFSGDEN